MQIGEIVRVPMIPGTGSGLRRWGTIVAVYSDQKAVRVRLAYGSRWFENAYSIAELEAEAAAYRTRRRKKKSPSPAESEGA